MKETGRETEKERVRKKERKKERKSEKERKIDLQKKFSCCSKSTRIKLLIPKEIRQALKSRRKKTP